MTVVAGDDAYKKKKKNRQITSIIDTSRTQQLDTRPEPFKGIFSAVGFTSKRGTSVGTRNKILLVSKQ